MSVPSRAPRFVDEIVLYGEIDADELRWKRVVCVDAPHFCGSVEHIFGSLGLEKLSYSCLFSEVHFGGGAKQ